MLFNLSSLITLLFLLVPGALANRVKIVTVTVYNEDACSTLAPFSAWPSTRSTDVPVAYSSSVFNTDAFNLVSLGTDSSTATRTSPLNIFQSSGSNSATAPSRATTATSPGNIVQSSPIEQTILATETCATSLVDLDLTSTSSPAYPTSSGSTVYVYLTTVTDVTVSSSPTPTDYESGYDSSTTMYDTTSYVTVHGDTTTGYDTTSYVTVYDDYTPTEYIYVTPTSTVVEEYTGYQTVDQYSTTETIEYVSYYTSTMYLTETEQAPSPTATVSAEPSSSSNAEFIVDNPKSTFTTTVVIGGTTMTKLIVEELPRHTGTLTPNATIVSVPFNLTRNYSLAEAFAKTVSDIATTGTFLNSTTAPSLVADATTTGGVQYTTSSLISEEQASRTQTYNSTSERNPGVQSTSSQFAATTDVTSTSQPLTSASAVTTIFSDETTTTIWRTITVTVTLIEDGDTRLSTYQTVVSDCEGNDLCSSTSSIRVSSSSALSPTTTQDSVAESTSFAPQTSPSTTEVSATAVSATLSTTTGPSSPAQSSSEQATTAVSMSETLSSAVRATSSSFSSSTSDLPVSLRQSGSPTEAENIIFGSTQSEPSTIATQPTPISSIAVTTVNATFTASNESLIGIALSNSTASF